MRATSFAAVLALAIPLAACFTPRVEPKVSQAVLDARAHRDIRAPACDNASPGAPVSAGFGFGDATLGAAARRSLDTAAAWLTCHPQAGAVIKGSADNHGTAAEQTTLANRRVEAAIGYLTAHGVAATRLRSLAAGEAEPAGEHLLILAEGQRW